MVSQPTLDAPFTVSQITGNIQQTLEQNFASVWVKGEVSNLTRHGSGHWYFSLKDRGAQLGSVMFKRENDRVRFEIAHGMEVTVHGRISVYPPHGKYQLIVDQMLPAGQGDLHLAFEALKQKLLEEGAFEMARKRPLPKYPRNIGIVTSPTGAAIQDMINILGRRYPLAEILLAPVRVQGEGAATEIVAAIHLLNEQAASDVLIIGRGGGSLEDLWAFNEEIVARAILASRIPIVSAVGHETDTTISDFVADRRAPTPSAAAELVVPDQSELRDRLDRLSRDLQNRLQKRIRSYEDRLTAIQDSYALRRPVLIMEQLQQRLDQYELRAQRSLVQSLSDRTHRLDLMEQRLTAVNPLAILQRGYAVIQNSATDLVRSTGDIHVGDKLRIRLQDGHLDSTIDAIQKKRK